MKKVVLIAAVVSLLIFETAIPAHAASLFQWSRSRNSVFILKPGPNLFTFTFEHPDAELESELRGPVNPVLVGKKILIDPGHGGANPGALGPGGTTEADNVLAKSLILAEMLRADGAEVIMTREGAGDVPGPRSVHQLERRVRIAENSGADIFVSIHNNTHRNKNIKGTLTFYYSPAKESKLLAEAIQDELSSQLGSKDLGTSRRAFYVLRNTSMPSVLVEVGFLTNPEEGLRLADPVYQRQAAEGVYKGIIRYFEAEARE
ncbi:MAG: N-acetylmuramoyl-L-alanine amidase [Bacillota bacterium]